MFEAGIVRVFDVFDVAEQARAALLQEGFEADAVVLSVRADEAGPVEGNFAVGNTPVESDAHVYAQNYHPAERGHCLMMVQAGSAQLAERAALILARFGARDPDPAHR